MLDQINFHSRDPFISFTDNGHLYTIQNVPGHPISVTTAIHKFFPKFDADKIIAGMMKKKDWEQSKYFGMTPEEIKKQWEENGKKQSGLGTDMHEAIEIYIDNEVYLQQPLDIKVPSPEECKTAPAAPEAGFPIKVPTVEEQTKWNIPRLPSVGSQISRDSKEFGFFLDFWTELKKKHPNIKVYRTEWKVYDVDKFIAGSIDLVLVNENGEIIICDWKRSKEIKFKGWEDRNGNRKKGFGIFSHLDDCNFIHYTLQLNIYRHLLELHYGKKVIGLYLVICHPNYERPEVIPVERLEKEIIDFWDSLPMEADH